MKNLHTITPEIRPDWFETARGILAVDVTYIFRIHATLTDQAEYALGRNVRPGRPPMWNFMDRNLIRDYGTNRGPSNERRAASITDDMVYAAWRLE